MLDWNEAKKLLSEIIGIQPDDQTKPCCTVLTNVRLTNIKFKIHVEVL